MIDNQKSITVLIPLYNEEWAIFPLFRKLKTVIESEQRFKWKILFVDDGSKDGTAKNIDQLEQQESNVSVVRLRRNYGLTQALQAGFDHANTDYVVTISGNLQNDPKDIPELVSKLNEGFDVCVGWRKSQEGKLYREKPSRFINGLISRISAVKLHDYECALRAYRTEAVRGLRLSGNLDLYIPVYVSWQGGRITEVSVTQLPRSHGHGVSENRTKRTLKTLLDLVFLKFLQRYSAKPLYVFGSLGIVSLLSSFVSFGFMVFYKMTGGPSFIETPLPLLTALFFLTGLMLLVLGIMTEFLTRIYQFNARTEFYDLAEKPGQKG